MAINLTHQEGGEMAEQHADANYLAWIMLAGLGLWNAFLSLVIGRGVPWLVGVHTRIEKHEDRIMAVERASQHIPEIKEKLALIADRMPKRSEDHERRVGD